MNTNQTQRSCIPCPVRLADLTRWYDDLVEQITLHVNDESTNRDPTVASERLAHVLQTLQLVIRILQTCELNVQQQTILDTTLRRTKLIIRLLAFGTAGEVNNDEDFTLEVTSQPPEGGSDALLEWRFVQENILQDLGDDQLVDEEAYLLRWADTPIPPASSAELATIPTCPTPIQQRQQLLEAIRQEWNC